MSDKNALIIVIIAAAVYVFFTRQPAAQATIESAPFSGASTNVPWYAVYNTIAPADFSMTETLNSNVINADGGKQCDICSLFGATTGNSY